MRSTNQTPVSSHGGVPLGVLMQATFEKDTRVVDNLKIFRDSKLEREQRVSFSGD